MSELKKKISETLLTFNPDKLTEVTEKSLKEGHAPLDMLDAIIFALEDIGNRFKKGELFLTHLVIAGENAKKTISEILEPILKKTNIERKVAGRIVIGTVAGDIHDIGVSIVESMLFSSGFEIINLGNDVSTETFIKAIEKYNPDIVGLSALLSTTLPMQKKLIDALTEHNLRDKVKVIVGGAPVTAEWAEEIGADGYAEDAVEVVKVIRNLIGGAK